MNDFFTQELLMLWKTKATWLPTLGFLHLGLFFYIRNQITKSLLSTSLSLVYLFFLAPIMEIMPLLGVDSFHEATNFEISEAFFWLTALLSNASSTDWQYAKPWMTTYIIYFLTWYIFWQQTHKKQPLQKLYYSCKTLTIISLTILVPISSISSIAQAFTRSSGHDSDLLIG